MNIIFDSICHFFPCIHTFQEYIKKKQRDIVCPYLDVQETKSKVQKCIKEAEKSQTNPNIFIKQVVGRTVANDLPKLYSNNNNNKTFSSSWDQLHSLTQKERKGHKKN